MWKLSLMFQLLYTLDPQDSKLGVTLLPKIELPSLSQQSGT
jgi:hypothetical protein